MLANVNVVLSHPTIHEMEVDLAAMQVRLNELLAARPFEDHHFVEIAAIFNNVSYMFLYLESNSIHIDFDVLLPWKDRFFNDERLDEQLLAALSGLRCAESDLERSREAYVGVLRAKRHAEPDPNTDEIANGLLRAKEIVGLIGADVTAFLGSLNVSSIGSRPEATFYALASRTQNWATRRRLHSAWRRVRDTRLDDLAAAIDHVVWRRWEQARRQGYRTVLRRTFEKCGVSVEQAKTFLNEYTARAIDSYAQLCRIIGDGTPASNAAPSIDDFGFHLVQHYGTDTMPLLALDGCLRFAFDVGHRVLGLDFERIGGVGDWLIQVDVFKDSRPAGRIHFDLWAEHNQPKDANFTRSLRNRTAWNAVEQIPVAHVSCRFRRQDGSRELLNFQNVHSLFHEFGHALNHLFIKQRMPNQSGLEYLPLERLEILSMWFEKWIFQPEFASYVTNSDAGLNDLATAQEIKMLEYRRTHLDRAVTSLIDVMIHERPDLGVKAAFRELNERFGLEEACDFGAILPGFTWPMMQSNPGAYFAYLWAAAKSAEMFAPFLTSLLSEAPEARATWEALAECCEFDYVSAAPAVESVFAFYGG